MTERDLHLIWMAGVSWNGIRGTDRHLVTAMAQHVHILWVDPPVSPVTSARQRNISDRSFRPHIFVIDNRVTRLTTVALPGLTRAGVRTTTALLVRRQVRWALNRLDIRPFAVVSTYLADVLGYWGRDVVNVLYGTDDYVAGATLMGLSARHLRQQELRAVARADVVAAVSPQLAQRWAHLGADPVVIPNGCWPGQPGAHALPAEVPDLPRPVVGLIGQLSERIDLDILKAIADAGFSLLMVGPLDPRWEQQRFEELTGRPHVHYAGPVPAAAVPSYLAAIDIGITPYRDTPFNRASFPLKTLEYLGAGIPVVSTDLPAARWLREDLADGKHAAAADQILVLAHDNGEFVEMIGRIAVSKRHPARVSDPVVRHNCDQTRSDQCVAFAATHSWSRRADTFATVMGLPLLESAGLRAPTAKESKSKSTALVNNRREIIGG